MVVRFSLITSFLKVRKTRTDVRLMVYGKAEHASLGPESLRRSVPGIQPCAGYRSGFWYFRLTEKRRVWFLLNGRPRISGDGAN